MDARDGRLGSYNKAIQSTLLTSLNEADQLGCLATARWAHTQQSKYPCFSPAWHISIRGHKLTYTPNGQGYATSYPMLKLCSFPTIVITQTVWPDGRSNLRPVLRHPSPIPSQRCTPPSLPLPHFPRLTSAQATVQNNTRRAVSALLDRINQPVIWIGHSQGGLLSLLAADSRPSLVKAMILLEPQGPPFQNRIINLPAPGSSPWARPYGLTTNPIAYDPPVTNPAVDLPSLEYAAAPDSGLQDCFLQREPARKLVNMAQVPMLVVTSEASFHAGYDWCTARYLQQGGVDAKWMNLSAEGIHGNAHFIFMEKNNIQIAEAVYGWIKGKIGGMMR